MDDLGDNRILSNTVHVSFGTFYFKVQFIVTKIFLFYFLKLGLFSARISRRIFKNHKLILAILV